MIGLILTAEAEEARYFSGGEQADFTALCRARTGPGGTRSISPALARITS